MTTNFRVTVIQHKSEDSNPAAPLRIRMPGQGRSVLEQVIESYDLALVGRRYLVGRGPRNDVVVGSYRDRRGEVRIAYLGDYVSRTHGVFEVLSADELVYIDHSANGTLVESMRDEGGVLTPIEREGVVVHEDRTKLPVPCRMTFGGFKNEDHKLFCPAAEVRKADEAVAVQ